MSDDFTPLHGTVTPHSRLNVRRGRADVNAPIESKIEPGTKLTVIGTVQGVSVSGNNRWFAGENNTYFWSGACAAFLPDTAPPLTQGVSRRITGSIEPLSERDIKRIYGDPKYTERGKGAVSLESGWANENIVDLETPLLAPYGYSKIKVHQKAQNSFSRVFTAISKSGLADVIRTCAGTFVPRHKGWDPHRTLSPHTWGIAIDLNVPWNGYGNSPARIESIGSLRELVPIFEEEGFAWGCIFRHRIYAAACFSS